MALAGTAVLAVVLIAMTVLDAEWLGYTVVPLLFFVLVAREAVLHGRRWAAGVALVFVLLIGLNALATTR